MNEEKSMKPLKGLVDHLNTTSSGAAVEPIRLYLLRTINRMIPAYKRYGKTGFIHGNCEESLSLPFQMLSRSAVVMLYLNKYYDANFTHFTELLQT